MPHGGLQELRMVLASFCAPMAKASDFWMKDEHAAIAAHLFNYRVAIYDVGAARLGPNEDPSRLKEKIREQNMKPYVSFYDARDGHLKYSMKKMRGLIENPSDRTIHLLNDGVHYQFVNPNYDP